MAANKPASPSVRAALDRAQMVSNDLTAATERLNKSLKEIEAELVRLNLGVTAEVEVDRHDDPNSGDNVCKNLRFGKDNREWKLLWEVGLESDPESWTSTPLLNVSREVRVIAVGFLPALIEKLVETAEKEVAGVAAKAKEVEDLVQTVKSGMPF
jgi:hypothetical protein